MENSQKPQNALLSMHTLRIFHTGLGWVRTRVKDTLHRVEKFFPSISSLADNTISLPACFNLTL